MVKSLTPGFVLMSTSPLISVQDFTGAQEQVLLCAFAHEDTGDSRCTATSFSGSRDGFASDFAQFRKNVSQRNGGGGAGAEAKIELAIERIEALVDCGRLGVRLNGPVAWAEGGLCFLDCLERPGGHEGEDAGAEAGGQGRGGEHGLAEPGGGDLVERGVVLGDAAGVDDAIDANAVLGHALEDDAGVEGGAFDGGAELGLRGVDQVPAEGDAAEFGIDEDGAVAVVPAHAQEAGLAGAIMLDAAGQLGDFHSGAAGDG